MSVQLKWLGLAFLEMVTPEAKTIYFDPWTKDKGNPHCPVTLNDLNKADLVLVSHDHTSHIGSAVDLCKKTGAMLGGSAETVGKLANEGVSSTQILMNGKGYAPGTETEIQGIKVIATKAHHNSETEDAMGHIVILEDGTSVYHTGDTFQMAEMELYGERYHPDVMVLPIGGGHNMGPREAAEAVRVVAPKRVLPVHFERCENPDACLSEFHRHCHNLAPHVRIIEPVPGESVSLN